MGTHTRNSDLRSHVDFEEKIYGNPRFWEMKGIVAAQQAAEDSFLFQRLEHLFERGKIA